LTNYKDLVEAIVEEYPLGYLEVAHVQYYDDVLKIFPEVNSDQELIFGGCTNKDVFSTKVGKFKLQGGSKRYCFYF
jgi:hypothetical protein